MVVLILIGWDINDDIADILPSKLLFYTPTVRLNKKGEVSSIEIPPPQVFMYARERFYYSLCAWWEFNELYWSLRKFHLLSSMKNLYKVFKIAFTFKEFSFEVSEYVFEILFFY